MRSTGSTVEGSLVHTPRRGSLNSGSFPSPVRFLIISCFLDFTMAEVFSVSLLKNAGGWEALGGEREPSLWEENEPVCMMVISFYFLVPILLCFFVFMLDQKGMFASHPVSTGSNQFTAKDKVSEKQILF